MSSGPVPSWSIRSSFQTFRGYARDLIDAAPTDQASIAQRHSVFTTKLRLFINFAEKDDVFRYIAQLLHARGQNIAQWYAEVAGGASGAHPETPSEDLAHRYLVLHAVKSGRVDMRGLVSTLFGAAGDYTDAFGRFRDIYIEGFIRKMTGYLARIEEAAGDGDPVLDDLAERVLDSLDASEAPASASGKKAAGKKPTQRAGKAMKKKATAKKATAKKATAKKGVAKKGTTRKKGVAKKAGKAGAAKTAAKPKKAAGKKGARKKATGRAAAKAAKKPAKAAAKKKAGAARPAGKKVSAKKVSAKKVSAKKVSARKGAGKKAPGKKASRKKLARR